MSQAPSMPLYIDALIGDTLHLSPEEFGAYCLLLFATWRNNGAALRDNDRDLARVCRVSTARWKRSMRAKLAPFFNLDDGCWHQKRLEKEWAFIAEKRCKNAKNGSLSAYGKALKKRDPGSTNASTTQNPESIREILKEDSGSERYAPGCAREAGASDVADLVAAAKQALSLSTASRPKVAKRDQWLNNLASFVGSAFDGDARMAAWEAIEDCRAAGSREATPAHIRTAIDDLDKLYRAAEATQEAAA